MEGVVFNKVSILGVGFLGASLALAFRKNSLCKTIYGYGRTQENLIKAKKSGIIDDYSLDASKICEGSDLIVLATPVGVFKHIIGEIKGTLKKGALITDVGSIKGRLVYEIESSVPDGVFYIGSHPIAGGEKSGVDNANGDLFNDALCIITPTEFSPPEAADKIFRVWESIGSRVESMSPLRHDEIYAVVSHLPHLAAYALVNSVGDIEEDIISFAGRGFRDTTRIAMSPPEIWRDISVLNKDNLLKMIGVLKDNLSKMESYLKEDDIEGLENEFRRSQELRKRLK